MYLRKLAIQRWFKNSVLTKKDHTLSAVFQLLPVGTTRRRICAEDQSVSVPERDQRTRDSDAMIAPIHATKGGEDPAVNRWHGVFTVIIGRKGIVLEDGSPWLARRHEMGGV